MAGQLTPVQSVQHWPVYEPLVDLLQCFWPLSNSSKLAMLLGTWHMVQVMQHMHSIRLCIRKLPGSPSCTGYAHETMHRLKQIQITQELSADLFEFRGSQDAPSRMLRQCSSTHTACKHAQAQDGGKPSHETFGRISRTVYE